MIVYFQNEISEVFDKLHVVNGHDSCAAVIDTAGSASQSHDKISVANGNRHRPNLRKPINSKSNGFDEWNSLAQFEKFIKLEMENLAAANAEKHKTNGTNELSTTKASNNNNILKPEKHVSDFT